MGLSYPSAVLFHGPEALAKALEAARSYGRLLHEPFGQEGLKIEESRTIIDLMANAPLGDKPGVLILGPMDHAWPAAADALLKSLEEFEGDIVRPVLWAHDEGGVKATIRSRCIRRWCPGPEISDKAILEQVRILVESSLKGNRAGVLESLKDLEGDILLAATQILRERTVFSKGEVRLWERIRGVLRFHNPSPTEIKAVFLSTTTG